MTSLIIVSADEIPYIVVPPDKSGYKFSSGVIVDTNTKNYLYCVVAEVGPQDKGMGEVSIYAAWKMQDISIPKNTNEVEDRHMIGNTSQKAARKWKIILFEKSSPEPKQKKKKYGWKYKAKASEFRRQIKNVGSKCYDSSGKCLN